MSGTTFITRAPVRRTMADEWHSLPADDVLRRLDASPLGLNASDAARRLARFGPNELVRTARISPWRILLAQFVDVLVIVLIIFGAGRLPEIGEGIGKGIRNFRKAVKSPDEIDVTPERGPAEHPEKKS